MENTARLEMRGIKKSFFGVPVLKGIDLTLNKGDCLSLIGENGAGKSTLMKILCGVYAKDEGEILMDGRKVDIGNAKDAKDLGISVIYQELSLFKDMTVYENIFANNELAKWGKGGFLTALDIREMKRQARDVLHNRLKMDIDVDQTVGKLSFAQKQMVEIARAVHANSDIIIMDEPTTALEDKEKKTLFGIVRELRNQGKSVVFISHHLDETLENCNRVVVLRDGNVVLAKPTEELSEETLVQSMIGRSVDNYYPKVAYELGDTLLSVDGLSCGKTFQDISFDLHRREVLGILGLAGCGKYEIARSIFGLLPYDAGVIKINGRVIKNKNVKEAVKNRIAFLPSDRKTEGIFAVRDVRWNTTIANLGAICSKRRISHKKEDEITARYVDALGIRIRSPKQTIASLSGGNQQKVMLSRWFLNDPDVLLLEDPTRGIDVNAKTEVYNQIMRYVGQDKGVIIVGTEEEELFGLCDRIIVVREGKMTRVLDKKNTTLEEVKLAAKFNIVEKRGSV